MSIITRPDTSGSKKSLQSQKIGFMWLEITEKCQLECLHCYADSGPHGTHGLMTVTQWEQVISQGRDLGVVQVQFIGGEPTLHPDLSRLISHALAQGLQVEVFSNLAHVKPELWEVFAHPQVSLATSYYSNRTDEHELITKRRGSHRRTIEGIVEALRRDIPLRVGIIGVQDNQHVDEACRQLAELGVTNVSVDYLRQVGRGIRRDSQPDASQLCGQCTNGVLAISPSGEVWPCVFTRWLPIGNVREHSLVQIINSSRAETIKNELDETFTERKKSLNDHGNGCMPTCHPKNPCNPIKGPQCGPAGGGGGNCNPRGGRCQPRRPGMSLPDLGKPVNDQG